MPRRIIGAPGHDGPVPARLFPVFRDRDELPTSPDLGDRIIEALDRSKALIVICSPDAASSRWVNEEILTFRRMGRGDRIFAIIARGEPHAGTEKECFPRALLEAKVAEDQPTRSVEPIAADARPEGDGRENALLKVIAGILGIGFEALRQRELEASRRRTRIAQGIAAAMILLAAGAGTAGWLALQARGVAVERQQEAEAAGERATVALHSAIQAANTLVFDLAEQFRHRGLPSTVTRLILDEARRLQDRLAPSFPEDATLQRSRGVALGSVGVLLAVQGDAAAALDAQEEALRIFRSLAARDPQNTDWARGVSVSLDRIGDMRRRAGDAAAALDAYEEALRIARSLAAHDPQNTDWARDVAVGLVQIGDLRRQAGDAGAALDAYAEALSIERAIAARVPQNTGSVRGLLSSLNRFGSLFAQAGDAAAARDAHEEALRIARGLAARDPQNTEWARDVLITLLLIGDLLPFSPVGDAAAARDAYEEALRIARALAARDPQNMEWTHDVTVSLQRIGDLRLQMGDAAAALDAQGEALRIARALGARDPQNTQWDRAVSLGQQRIGDLHLQMGDGAAALDAYKEALRIARSLAVRDPENAQWARTVSVNLERIGDLLFQAGDAAAARDVFEESLRIARSLAARDPRDVRWAADVISSLVRISDVTTGERRRAVLVEAIARVAPLAAADRLSGAQRRWPAMLQRMLDDHDAAERAAAAPAPQPAPPSVPATARPADSSPTPNAQPARPTPTPPAASASTRPGVTDCDRLAQPLRSDLGRSALVEGVASTAINVPRARVACEFAISAHPQEPRFQTWLGRALQAGGLQDQAAAAYRRAAEQGHAFAQNLLGFMLEYGHGVTQNPAEAVEW
ncbi:MAG: TIR domain-containing protein, partial [Methylobacterium sp.]|nr:TIR domain-containing protein [Methylobacterium sp.]